MKTIESWIGKYVRIKNEYITKEILEDGTENYYISVDVPGLCGFFAGIERNIFKVQMDCYGVDLFPFMNEETEIDSLPNPTHKIITDASDYPILWDSKYFKLV